MDIYFVREKVTAKQLAIQFLCSADQITDALTKSLASVRFQMLRTKLTVVSTTLGLRGAVKIDDEDELEMTSRVSNGVVTTQLKTGAQQTTIKDSRQDQHLTV